jgi:hypothetical protein
MPGGESPVLADFTGINSLMASRSLDGISFYQGWTGNPIWWSNYTTWSSQLGAFMEISWAPGAGSLYGGGTSDGTLGNVTTGAADTYLNTAASTAASYGKTVYVRLTPEFNGSWNTYGYKSETAAQFVAGWQYVVTKFRTAGATNVKWWWCPNIWGASNNSEVDPTATDTSGVNWYPGDSYVDFIGLDGYMTKEQPSVLTPYQVFFPYYTNLTNLTNKPFGIGEIGVATDSRLSSLGGKAGWFNLMFQMIINDMPNCILVDYYNRNGPPDTPNDDYTINSSGADPAALTAFVEGVTNFPFKPPAAWSPGLLGRMAAG